MAVATLAVLAGSRLATAAPAELRPSVEESFPIGNSGPACEVQGTSMGDERRSMFDRKWVILCTDVARPVGTAYALRDPADAVQRIAAAREEALDCPEANAAFADEGMACTGVKSGLPWRVYMRRTDRGDVAVEGLAAYDDALRLTVRSLVADRVVDGPISIANLGSGDTLSLVRARAANSDPGLLLGQGYRGNSAGSFAEAAEFFAAAPAILADTAQDGGFSRETQIHEALVNRALQLSNLGAFAQAERNFAEARDMGLRDPVQSRLARNYAAIDAINRGELAEALDILGRDVAPFLPSDSTDAGVSIDRQTAAGLNAAAGTSLTALLGQPTRLSPQDRAAIIDAQALQLRGTALRLQDKPDEARQALARAYDDAMKVQDGRILSIARLRAQIMTELALGYEAQGRYGEAESNLRGALELVRTTYPDSASVNVVSARLAGFLSRRGQGAEAMAIYRAVVDDVMRNRGALVGMENLMRPYFDMLAGEGSRDEATVGELFRVSQLLQQTGAAETLTQLSRQLEGGSGEAAALYRRSLGISRELERTRIEIARLTAASEAGENDPRIDALRARRDQLADAQVAAMDALAAYPSYRAVAHRTASLPELRSSLRSGEGYLKLAQVAGSLYAVFISPTETRGWKVALSAQETADAVDTLRDSISLTINGVQSTYPFDVDTALALDEALLGPARTDVASLSHLIFEPAGAMLKLPLNLLTGDREGVAAYHARVEAGGDEYDFTGIDWLGRDRAVSTALSAASFRDARAAPASAAPRDYLGLGNNVPLGPVGSRPGIRSGEEVAIDADCVWPLSTWNQPISPRELNEAASLLAGGGADLMTGAAFTDEAIMARPDLGAFRIVHFATHGLVTAPRVGCPVRPALLTSFGDARSDGLLSFGEIFDLQLDADLVILSACDTAAGAGLEATREAGLATGGGQALDGLVRAFIAAGGRQVIASHWPAPDDFDATERLFNGFYKARGVSIGEALRTSQRRLMDDPLTSHPYYWAGFAVIGDATRPVPAQ
ncbi:CHAT domain-containing protein [Novosphingobium endophyticum]|uniref:CHAT domain-containing protein n=2 Tax=Novosphingobium endophyticum TaxID=1955250 RepID=A0A916TQL1_9SPHN|nr:CHAT domain-containing protein [Novosphingobium endophyticum]